MPDYDYLRKKCELDSRISEGVVDDFLVNYAAKKDNLSKEFDIRISKYRHALQGTPSSWLNLIKSQYIVHRVFRRGGLISKYLNHVAIKSLIPSDRDYLRAAEDQTWKFSFSVIASNPAPDFYNMEDVFTGEIFLLYSRSVTKTLKSQPVLTWFNLVSDNGECWQSFGPVIGFQSFSADDIFFFATELNRQIESDEDLLADLESNPIPYMMLATGSAFPLIQMRDHEVVQVTARSVPASFHKDRLAIDFELAFSSGIFKIIAPVLSELPHSATAYYDEYDKSAYLIALTDHGYLEMAQALNKHGFGLPLIPETRLHISMSTLIESLLKQDLELDPYAELFQEEQLPESKEAINKLNDFMALALPKINSNEIFDVDELAKEAGVDPGTAKELIQVSLQRIEELKNRSETR